MSDVDDLRERIRARVVAKRAGDPGPRHARPPSRRTRHPVAVRFLMMVVVVVAATAGLRAWVVEPFWIPSQSMEPALHGCPGCDEDRLLVNKLAYVLHGVRRGDVVVFRRPPDFHVDESNLVKRVIALPGEVVSGHGGQVWIGDRPLTEPYIPADCHGTRDFPPVRVPAGDVFVMGDNRCDSSDSRVFGPIRQSSIIGRAFLVFWPLSRIHWL